MGFFSWNKNKAPPPVPGQQELPKKEDAVPSVPEKVQPQPEQHAAPVDHAKPQDEMEMRKFVFRLSSHEPEKCGLFVKEIVRRVNRHDWHDLVGRVGKYSDGIKMRIDVKGKHDDIQNFIRWCKTGQNGVHAYEVIETKVHSVPYSGTPHFQELRGHWLTS